MRTIAIGDVHGCSKALQGLLEVIGPTSQDRLVFLGDYVDRGPDSKGVIERLIELSATCQTVFLLGNHDIMFRGALRGLDPGLWLQQGGSQTVTSYGGLLENVPDAHRHFLDHCLPYYETAEEIFLHGNYVAELELAEQPEDILFWEHLSDRLPGPHVSGKHVYCGHTPQRDGKIGFFEYLTCLDTCCFAGLWLSAIDIDSKEMWQVSREGHLRQDWRMVKQLWAKGRGIAQSMGDISRLRRSNGGGT